MKGVLDLGNGHRLTLTFDRETGAPSGAVHDHPWKDGPGPNGQVRRGGVIAFEGHGGDRPHWTIEQEEPLTLSPSLLCTRCGCHGWVREGRWVYT